MPAFNFKKQFAADVASGKKCQTIRAIRKDHRKPAKDGAVIALYTGMRTKGCRKLRDVVCTRVSRIVIDNDPYSVTVNGVEVQDEEAFAQADGFPGIAELFDFSTNRKSRMAERSKCRNSTGECGIRGRNEK